VEVIEGQLRQKGVASSHRTWSRPLYAHGKRLETEFSQPHRNSGADALCLERVGFGPLDSNLKWHTDNFLVIKEDVEPEESALIHFDCNV
jgi:hypothetical protein